MKNILLLLWLLPFILRGGTIVSGPMLCWTAHTEAAIWMETSCDVKSVELMYSQDSLFRQSSSKKWHPAITGNYCTHTYIIDELKLHTKYYYKVLIDGKEIAFSYPLTFTTHELWQWRKDPPDFSFILGSCFYFNDEPFDRPGNPYGQSRSILQSMCNTTADFNLWGGDNLYLREADYSSASGIQYRFHHDRMVPELQQLLALRPNIAIWDDHDFGPNDAYKGFMFKQISSDCFKAYFPASNYAANDGSIYRKYTFNDVDFFLMDDRFYRDANELPDSIGGKPNTEKRCWGKAQMEWLKQGLLNSGASFKIIVNGGQMLNPIAKKECLYHYPVEYYELIDFLKNSPVDGVLFLSGDRHFSELLRLPVDGSYPLYDFTCSAVLSGIHAPSGAEIKHPLRVDGSLIQQNNYSRLSIKGKGNNRTIYFEIFGLDGNLLWQHHLKYSDLKKP